MEYVPFEEINVYVDTSDVADPKVDQFHLQLSANTLSFSKAYESQTIILSNIGWDNMVFAGIKGAFAPFVLTHQIPQILLPKHNYSLVIQYNTNESSISNGGIYIDVGDSYGNKYVALTGVIS